MCYNRWSLLLFATNFTPHIEARPSEVHRMACGVSADGDGNYACNNPKGTHTQRGLRRN